MLALSLCSLSSCWSKKQVTHQTVRIHDETLKVLIQDSNINLKEEKVILIDDQKGLLAFYATLNATRTPGFEIPLVNFKNQSVIVVAMGQKNSGGYQVTKPVFLKSKNLFNFFYIKPKPLEPVTMSLTTPGIVVLVHLPVDKVIVKVHDK